MNNQPNPPIFTPENEARALAENERLRNNADAIGRSIPPELAKLMIELGEAAWGATDPLDADGHAAHVAESVRITAAHFGQAENQQMHGLYVAGTGTVICHTGTSPNSPNTARCLTAAWNFMLSHARSALAGDGIERGDHWKESQFRETMDDLRRERDSLRDLIHGHIAAANDAAAVLQKQENSRNELKRQRDAALAALKVANDAIAEYIRYLDGGEIRGSYDGKPERQGLREAHYKARQVLAQIEA